MYVLRRDISQINGIDQGGDPLIFRHPRHRSDIGDFRVMKGFILSDRLLSLEEPGPSGNAHGLQGRGDCETDRLV